MPVDGPGLKSETLSKMADILDRLLAKHVAAVAQNVHWAHSGSEYAVNWLTAEGMKKWGQIMELAIKLDELGEKDRARTVMNRLSDLFITMSDELDCPDPACATDDLDLVTAPNLYCKHGRWIVYRKP